MLEHDERVNLYYTNNVDDLMKADIILLPGSKSTIDDLYELRRNGVAQAILQARRNGATVMGICGGYQMMGQRIADPDGVEGSISQMPGLGLLPTETVIEEEKVTRQVRFAFLSSEEPTCTGYGIGMGQYFGGGRRDFDSVSTSGERRNGWLCGGPEMCRFRYSRHTG